MRKNRVKISQSKVKTNINDQRDDSKELILLKELINISSDLSEIDIPVEEIYKIPACTKINSYQPEEPEIKSSSSEFLQDKSNQKQELFFENSQSDFGAITDNMIEGYSDIESNQPKDIINQIKVLQQELSTMNQRIICTEEEMKSKEVETQELKELLLKLRENQVLIIESSESQSSCKACIIF